ncbi:MAG: LytR/AlgR family response regulator transcription factor [Phycisphaerales bacterium JB059]
MKATVPTRWMPLALALVAISLALAALGATQQQVQLAGTPKQMSWLAAFLYQAPSWLVLTPMATVVFVVVRRWPPEGERAVRRIALYLIASVAFGLVFLWIAIPVRRLLHPAPVVWSFFGAPFYKSGPQWAVIGIACFWASLLAGAYADTRRRLVEREPAPDPVGTPPPVRISVETRAGRAVLDPGTITHITAEPRGARIHTPDGAVEARASLARLEQDLGEFGIVRVHRANLVNLGHVREVLGSPHRDGTLRLSTGRSVPVSRRRWDALGTLAPGRPGATSTPGG